MAALTMMDWTLFARYAAPVITLFVGIALNRYLEKRARVVSYLAHTSAVRVNPPNGEVFQVHTHSIVVLNSGKTAAKNVRLGHFMLPDFSVYPKVGYDVVDTSSGGREIVFPTLVPNEQVTVTYLYFPPIIWSSINSYTKSDEGFARIINVLPAPKPSPWVTRLTWVLIAIGAITVLAGLGQPFALAMRHL